MPVPRPIGLQLRWRTLEWIGVAAALFIQTGAVSVLAFTDEGGNLTAQGTRILQAMSLPVYAVTLLLLARHRLLLAKAIRRNLPMAALLALPFLSILWSINVTVTMRRAVGLLLSVLLAYLIAIRFTPRQFLLLLLIVTGGCMGLSLVGAVAVPNLATMPYTGEFRGVFNHKNVLGWNAVIAVLAAAAATCDRGLRRHGLVVMVASLACLLLSHSTTALLSTTAVGFFVSFYAVLGRLRGLARVVLILLTLQLLGVLLVSLNSILAAVVENTEKDMSLTGRVPLWELVDASISRRPFFGYGYQAFWTEGNGDAWAIWDRIGWPAPHAHNGIRDTLLSLGVVGATLLFVVVAQALRKGAVLQSRYPTEGWLWLNVLLCTFLFMNLTESILMTQNSFLFNIFMVAVLMTSLRERRL